MATRYAAHVAGISIPVDASPPPDQTRWPHIWAEIDRYGVEAWLPFRRAAVQQRIEAAIDRATFKEGNAVIDDWGNQMLASPEAQRRMRQAGRTAALALWGQEYQSAHKAVFKRGPDEPAPPPPPRGPDLLDQLAAAKARQAQAAAAAAQHARALAELPAVVRDLVERVAALEARLNGLSAVEAQRSPSDDAGPLAR